MLTTKPSSPRWTSAAHPESAQIEDEGEGIHDLENHLESRMLGKELSHLVKI